MQYGTGSLITSCNLSWGRTTRASWRAWLASLTTEKLQVTSRKRRTSSKSGPSEASAKKGTSSRKGGISRTAAASFEEIFGKGLDNPETQRLRRLRLAEEGRLASLEAEPEPTLAIYRHRHRQRLGNARRRIRQLQEAIEAAETTTA